MSPIAKRHRSGKIGGECCPICGTSITWQQARREQTCGNWRCRKSYRDQERATRQEQERQLQLEHQRRLDQVVSVRETRSEAEKIMCSDAFLPIIVPANTRRLVPLSSRRRYRFAKKLMQIAQVAIDGLPPDPPPSDVEVDGQEPTLPVLDSACITCQGHCCLRGGTHAYLHASTISRYLATHPTATTSDVISAYCRHLPLATYEGSCVFHSETECTLPRDMRSATCNNTVCSGFIEARNSLEHQGHTRFFFSAMDRRGVVRSRFVEGDPNGDTT